MFCLLSGILRTLEDRLTLLRSSPSSHQVFCLLAQLQVVPSRQCASRVRRDGFAREAFFKMFKPLWYLVRPVSQCLANWICHPTFGPGSPGSRHRIQELYPTNLLLLGQLGFAIGRPSLKVDIGHATFFGNHNMWHMVVRLAHCHAPIFYQRWCLSPCPITRAAHFLAQIIQK